MGTISLPTGGEPFPTGGVLPHRGRPLYSPKGSLSPTGETIQPPQRESKTRITNKQEQTNRTKTNKNPKRGDDPVAQRSRESKPGGAILAHHQPITGASPAHHRPITGPFHCVDPRRGNEEPGSFYDYSCRIHLQGAYYKEHQSQRNIVVCPGIYQSAHYQKGRLFARGILFHMELI